MTGHSVYHVVTERPMERGQHIRFDGEHHNGVYARVMAKRELAMEEVRAVPNHYI